MSVVNGLNLIEPAAASIVAALLNSLWQGMLLAVVALLIVKSLRFVNATTRYVVWCVALVAIGVLSLSISMEWNSATETPEATESSAWIDGLPLASPFASEWSIVERPRALSSQTELPTLPTVAENGAAWGLPIQLTPSRWALLMAFAWSAIAFLMLGRVLWSTLYLHRLKRTSRPVGERFQSRLEAWRKVSGSLRAVELRCSDRVTGPLAAGLNRPVILLPCNLVEKLTDEELDQVGLHEMAHLARWDDWTNFVQKLFEAVFFFHPAVLWIGRQLNLEREIACDDWVIFRTGKPKPYAACLTRLVELTGRMDVPALAPGSWTTRKQISRRIEMSLNRSRNVTPRLSKASLFVSLLILLFVGVQFARTSPLVRAAGQEIETQDKVVPDEETPQEERPLTPGELTALDEEVAKERRQHLRELEESRLVEREAVAERRAIEQEYRRAEQQYEVEARLAELEREQGMLYARPVLMSHDEEPAIPEDELLDLMLAIVRNDSDPKVRSAALESIGHLRSGAAGDALAELYDSLTDIELKKTVIHYLSYNRSETAIKKLKTIAVKDTSAELRLAAVHSLGQPHGRGFLAPHRELLHRDEAAILAPPVPVKPPRPPKLPEHEK